MSLISDALKEAQRERSGRAADQGAVPLVEGVFPYPSGEKKASKTDVMVIIGAVGGVAVAAAVGIVLAVNFGLRHQATAKPVSSLHTPPPVASTSRSSTPSAPVTAPAATAPKAEDVAPRTAPPRAVVSQPQRNPAPVRSAPTIASRNEPSIAQRKAIKPLSGTASRDSVPARIPSGAASSTASAGSPTPPTVAGSPASGG